MDFYSDESTIIALSTPSGVNSAIAIIRISGNFSLDEFQSIFSSDIAKVQPRTAHFTSIIDPISHDVIDQVLLTFFSKNASYNGENILEISCHGNTVIIDQIIQLFLTNFSIRMAKPGEFTFRAYRNNKLSLTQIEGLDLLLNANSAHTLHSARSLFTGELNSDFLLLQELIKNFKSAVNLSLDFSEDIGDDQAKHLFKDSLKRLYGHVKVLYGRTQSKAASLLNPSIVLFGNTNAGKSTLFNYLIGSERAIVSEIKGTTRDYISDVITCDNSHFRLIDTAGIRRTEDKIEQQGIERSLNLLDSAFFKIKLIPFADFTPNDIEEKFDLIVITHVKTPCIIDYQFLQKNIIFTDLVGPMGPVLFGPIGPVKEVESGPIGPIKIADCGPMGPESLRDNILNRVKTKYDRAFENNPILIERQQSLISELFSLLQANIDTLLVEEDFAIIDFYVNKISLVGEELIGIITPDQLLASIFNNFCIGK